MSYNTVPEMGGDEVNVDQAPSELDPLRAPTPLARMPGQGLQPSGEPHLGLPIRDSRFGGWGI